MKNILYFIIAFMMAAVSCSELAEEVKKPSIVLAEDQKIEVNVKAEGEIINISFHSTLEWKAEIVTSDSTEWLQIIPASGKGGDVNCKVKADKNLTGEKRSAIISFVSQEANRRVKLVQSADSDASDDSDREDDEDYGNEEPDSDGDNGGDSNGSDNDGDNDGDNYVGGTVEPGQSGKYGWYELPKFNYTQSGNYMIDAQNSDLYYAHHLCAGNERDPKGGKARNYTVCYSAEHHCPVWVAAPRHKMYQSGASRTDSYGKDPSIPSSIQYNSKSTGGGCNKGHMLGSAERLSSSATNKQVFYYTNIAPQYSDTFNTGGGGWNILEDWVDGQVCSDTLYVVIGAYFEKYTDRRGYTGSPKTIEFGGRSDVTRPSMFYYILMRTKKGNSGKALKDCSTSEIKCAAFVRSHETPKKISVSEKDMMSVSDLEKITGFTYFPNVPQAPKGSYTASDWGL